MSKTISLLGSTGSIGRQTLEVARELGLRVAALTANQSVDLLEQQAREFLPGLVVLGDMASAMDLAGRLKGLPIRVAYGMEGLIEAASLPEADTVVTAVVGMVGLRPTLAAIEKGKRIALANKETLVCAGELVMAAADRCGAEIVPVDSEHSAIFQCLQGCRDRPFYGKTFEELEGMTREKALRHPNWSMGAKITVDCATLMNKGLEFIEAMRLYRVTPDQIQVVIHRQSIVHSLVEYRDGAVLAQLGTPDMRLPIRYALTWPTGPSLRRSLWTFSTVRPSLLPRRILRPSPVWGWPWTAPAPAVPPAPSSTAPTRRRWASFWRGRSASTRSLVW